MRIPFTCGAVLAAAITFGANAGTLCSSDVDASGVVDVGDLLEVLAEWGCVGCNTDLDGSGMTDVGDILIVLADWGCATNVGPSTTLSGTVLNLTTGLPIEGASVSVGGDVVMTDVTGGYTGMFEVGIQEIVVSAEYFDSVTDSIVLFPDLASVFDADLMPVAPVIVNIIVPDGDPGDTIQAMAEVIVLDGSTIQTYDWMQTEGAPVVSLVENMDLADIDLGPLGDYKAELFQNLMDPPISEDELPANVPLPPDPFPAGLQDRFEVVGVNPFALERAGMIGLSVDVTTDSGVYSAETEIHSHLPYKVSSGLRNQPIDALVLLYGKDQMSYDWVMASRPAGSVSVIIDATTQNPEFTPDVPGLYEFTVTDLATAMPVTIQVWAGNWRGVIVGQDGEGRPVSDTDCTGCHSNLGVDQFALWSQTGHAEIFTNNLDTSTHYGPGCFACHTVGYDPDSDNNGMDEAFDYDDFLAGGLLNNPGDNWTTMLGLYPWTAQVSNIQCENCHGPQWGLLGVNTGAHGPVGPMGEPRASLSSDVCATCHGEPLRHARFQQWQLSGHANYEVAIDESDSGSCSRCHTANGFLAWLPILLGDVPGDPLADIPVTWTPDEAHPQTCVACHDPHAEGTTSGIPTNATVRISDTTPPLIAGFTGYGVGRGAICMTCHNSRRGLRNDDTFASFYGTSEATRAPHGSSQTDVLMGENAYMVETGIRGNHSFLTDTCVSCHMEETPPPDALSYNTGGTNHTFYASPDICANCHVGLDAEFIQGGVQDTLNILQGEVEAAILSYIGDQTALGNIIDLNGAGQITDVADVADIEFGEFRGRQAMTVTFTDMMVLGPYRMSDVDILNSGMVFIEGFYDSADPNLIKSGWNYNLVNNDGSLGVHNPSYGYLVLTRAIESLNPAAASEIDIPDWALTARPDFRPLQRKAK